MAIDALALYGALYTLLRGTVSQGVAGSVLTLQQASQLLDPTEYANPWSPTNPGGLTLAAEKFASLTDVVPAASPVFQDTGLSLANIYGQFVGGRSADAGVAQLLSGAKGMFDRAARGSVIDPTSEWRSCDATPALWYAAETGEQFVAVETSSCVPAAPRAAEAAVPAQARVGGRLLDAVDAGELDPPARSAAVVEPDEESRSPALPPEFDPALVDALRRRGAWLTGPDVASLAAAARTPAAGGMDRWLRGAAERIGPHQGSAAAAPDRELRFDVETPAPPAAAANDALDDATGPIGISLRYLVVGLTRRWLDPSVFSLTPVTVPGRPARGFSNGQPVDNPGLLPLLPVAMVVARDLAISAGRWGSNDLAQIERATAGTQAIALGPIVLNTGGSEPSAPARAAFDGTVIRAPGLHLLGWVCRVVPPSPLP